ncbi:MAG: ubiquinol-cytochrome c reductase iron-sulfur subunit [Candidatus Binataceae bacterium]|nr:ubiquinol-cytochrome c reductase iron-sulfur subunit [Candidatus Binataceae bacterium]
MTNEPQIPPNEASTPASGSITAERRKFLAWLSIGLSGLIAMLLGIPVIGFILGPLFQELPETWREVGAVDQFAIGTTVKVSFLDPSPMLWAGVTAQTAAWLRRVSADEFTAFAMNCSHLGCPVRWLPQAQLFMCPCHGGVYYADGTVAAGPPPRGLFHLPVRIRGGKVEIRASAVPIE